MLFRRWRTPKSGQAVLAGALYRQDRRDRERVERWWAAGGDDRDKVSRAAWHLLAEAYFRFGNHEQPERVAPVLEFLLESEPTSPHLPRVRLTSCLPPDATEPPDFGDPDVRRLVDAALGYPDPALRQRLADLLSVTDQPGLLDALEVEFRLRARPDRRHKRKMQQKRRAQCPPRGTRKSAS